MEDIILHPIGVSMPVRMRRIYDEKYADLWSELWLIPGAPEQVITAVYHTLSKAYHPDKHGDPLAQQRLNDTYKKVMTLRRKMDIE